MVISPETGALPAIESLYAGEPSGEMFKAAYPKLPWQ